MYLIDTNIVSEARRGTKEAVSWLRSVDPLSVFLSVVTLGEVMRGIVLKQKSDPRAAAHYHRNPPNPPALSSSRFKTPAPSPMGRRRLA
jgi:predicted nucleic acid-binding protein